MTVKSVFRTQLVLLRSLPMADFQNYLVYFLVSLVFVIMVGAIRRRSHRRPPGPIALPFVGHLHLIGPKFHRSLQELSQRYGPLVQLYFGTNPFLVVSSQEMAKEFLQTHDLTFSNHQKKRFGDIISYGCNDLSFAPYGPRWRFMKKICMTSVLNSHTLLGFEPVRRDERNLFIKALVEKGEAGVAVNLRDQLSILSNNIGSRMSMNQRCSERESEAGRLKSSMDDIMRLAAKIDLADYIPFLRNFDVQGCNKMALAAHHNFDMMMESIIKEHEEARRKKEAGDGDAVLTDFLHILLDTMEDPNVEEGMTLTRENIKGLLLNVFGGATETPTNTMLWAIAELINHPDVVEKARQEIESVVGKERLVEESDIPNLPLVQAIIRETLRLHPGFAVLGRRSVQDSTVAGYYVPANTEVLINIWALGRDPKYWDNPLEFSPTRFLNEDGSINKSTDVKGQHFCLLPFGSGRRTCPGTALTLQMLHSAIAAVIQCFDWKLVDGENGKVDMEEGYGSSKKLPLICVPVVRFNPFLAHVC